MNYWALQNSCCSNCHFYSIIAISWCCRRETKATVKRVVRKDRWISNRCFEERNWRYPSRVSIGTLNSPKKQNSFCRSQYVNFINYKNTIYSFIFRNFARNEFRPIASKPSNRMINRITNWCTYSDSFSGGYCVDRECYSWKIRRYFTIVENNCCLWYTIRCWSTNPYKTEV